MRVGPLFLGAIVALASARCVRRAPTATATGHRERSTSNRSAISQSIARSPDDASASTGLAVASDASRSPLEAQLEAEAARAAIAPLFARKVTRLASVDPRGYSRQRRQDGGAATALSMSELVARPWLWALYPGAFAFVRSFGDPRDADAGARFDRGAARDRVLAVADDYLGFGHVDDQFRWAPFNCLMPPSGAPSADLGPDAPHGRKLYYLYARDRAAYLANRDVPGQIVVKEAWTPEEVPLSDAVSTSYPPQCARVRDGRCLQPGRFNGLFVMMRADDMRDTDRGWLYATVDPRGEVTASGQIASCVRCHERAPHGRLFGLLGDAGLTPR